jgi:hypothetical protein
MKIVTLTPQERTQAQATHKVILTYADLTAAATTQTITIFPSSGTFPAGTVARFTAMRLITPFDFSDSSINSLLLEVGDTDTDRLLTQTQLAADGTYVSNKVSSASTQPYAYDAADTIDALFTVAGGGTPLLNEATSGEVEVYLHITDLADLTIAQ